MSGHVHDVVVLGAGVAGMSAAWELREHDVLVLEREERVGGRTLSGGDASHWYNAGAQVVSSPRLQELCRELGLELVDATGADFAIAVGRRLVRSRRPEALALRLPLSVGERMDFMITALRLQRLLRKLKVDPAGYDDRSLADTMGRVKPSTASLFTSFSAGSNGSSPDQISALIGLAYSLELFLDAEARKHSKAVRGGNQRIAEALADALGRERVVLGARVRELRHEGDGVRVVYEHGGETVEVAARRAVCSLPTRPTLEVVRDLPAAKRTALQRTTPYHPIVSVVWPTRADAGPAPWDGLLMVPVAGPSSMTMVSNNDYFARRAPGAGGAGGGYLVTLAVGERGLELRDIPDEDVVHQTGDDLAGMFPGGDRLLLREQASVHRWEGLPRFRPGFVRLRDDLRSDFDKIAFCGDYTSQPGLTGAHGSGYQVGSRLAAGLRETGAVPA